MLQITKATDVAKTTLYLAGSWLHFDDKCESHFNCSAASTSSTTLVAVFSGTDSTSASASTVLMDERTALITPAWSCKGLADPLPGRNSLCQASSLDGDLRERERAWLNIRNLRDCGHLTALHLKSKIRRAISQCGHQPQSKPNIPQSLISSGAPDASQFSRCRHDLLNQHCEEG